MHYSFHSTPTCTFRGRSESYPNIIQQSLNQINQSQAQDQETTLSKNPSRKLQPYPNYLNLGISISHLNQTPALDPTNPNLILRYINYYSGRPKAINESAIH